LIFQAHLLEIHARFIFYFVILNAVKDLDFSCMD